MPTDKLTPQHYKALQAVLEVADPSTGNGNDETPEEVIWGTAKQALWIIGEMHPEILPDPLTPEDRNLLEGFENACNRFADGFDKDYKLYKRMMEVRLTR